MVKLACFEKIYNIDHLLPQVIQRPLGSATPTSSPVMMVDSSDAPRGRDHRLDDVHVAIVGLVEIFQVSTVIMEF